MDRMAERISSGRQGSLENPQEPVGLQNILKKIPVSSIFPNASRRGRKANQPRKRTHPDTLDLAASMEQDYHGESTSLQPNPAISPLLPEGPTNKKASRRAAERPQQRPARTASERRDVSEKILNLTMEIISVLAGEECTLVTKSGEPVILVACPLVTGGPISASVGQTLKQERQSEQRILDLTFRIIQLLTGEIPSHDGAASHTKGRKRSPYRSVIVERGQPSTSQGAQLSRTAGQEGVSGANEEQAREIGINTETDAYAQTVHTPHKGQIKEESSGSDCTTSDHADFTAIRIKEESATVEDVPAADGGPFLSIKIKEECVSEEEHGEEGEAGEAHRLPRYRKTPYSSSHHTEDSGDSTMFAPSGFEQYAPTHTELAPMLFPSSTGPVDFLGFDDNSNLDTDVSALIKHAHTKFTFAPIEGVSGSEEDEPLLESDLQPPKDDAAQKSALGTEDPAASCEEGPSEEVTSTKKDRGMKTYACSECGECFVRRSDFANHRRDHRRERLTCPECGKVFANKPSLLNHLTGHTGEKPYSCPVCGKCFTRNSNLIVHQATHMERSPFTALNVGDMLVNQIL